MLSIIFFGERDPLADRREYLPAVRAADVVLRVATNGQLVEVLKHRWYRPNEHFPIAMLPVLQRGERPVEHVEMIAVASQASP